MSDVKTKVITVTGDYGVYTFHVAVAERIVTLITFAEPGSAASITSMFEVPDDIQISFYKTLRKICN